ncbi:hypothetical protein [Sphingomonas hankookensis]|uniref:hypothetical protein n=1 Tax=Sphingomonas hankookensis TaxID=563996 RepID=UPI003D303A5A
MRHDRAGGDRGKRYGGKDAAGAGQGHARLLTKQAWKSKRDVDTAMWNPHRPAPHPATHSVS